MAKAKREFIVNEELQKASIIVSNVAVLVADVKAHRREYGPADIAWKCIDVIDAAVIAMQQLVLAMMPPTVDIDSQILEAKGDVDVENELEGSRT